MINSINLYFAYLSILSFFLRNRNFSARIVGYVANFMIYSKYLEIFDYNFHQIAPNLAGNAFSMLENDPCLHPHCMVCKEFGIIFLFMMSFY